MRINHIASVLLLAFFWIFQGCQNESPDAGVSTLSQEDEIRVKVDTFDVVSVLDSCAAIALTPDSFLLGECDTHFGTIKADILAQMACPEGFEYPGTDLEVDSICLYMHYMSWYGDGNAPMGIAVYEMDRQTLLENETYESDLQLADYCSLADSTLIVSSSPMLVPNAPLDSSYSTEQEDYVPVVRIRLSDAFAQRFFKIKSFSTQQAFNEVFKGLYICSDFGGSNVLYIRDISMTVFYHFAMPRPGVADSVVYDTKSFYVNEEVRQVNRFMYPHRGAVLEYYSHNVDTNYVVSPANIYTQLSVRMDSIANRIEQRLGNADDYRVYVNKADITVDVLYSDSVTERPRDNWDTPAGYMMLIREDKLGTFFSNNELPSDTIALIASLSASESESGNISYSYTYDLAPLLTQQLRADEVQDELNFVLVPVSVVSNSSTGAITSVKQLQTISATRIRSANNAVDPMDVEVVYAGFNKRR
jgi:hypothetical protein